MDWTTLFAALAGGAVSIATAWLTNRSQLKRDRDARGEERKRDEIEYGRRRQEEIHERARTEADTLVRAVAHSEGAELLVAHRSGQKFTDNPARHLSQAEVGEWNEWMARASASSRALRLIDDRLGTAAQEVVDELREVGPGGSPGLYSSESAPRLHLRLDRLVDLTREFLAPEKAAEGRS